MSKRKFELAPQIQVGLFATEIARLLDVLGHPEALVTDESRLADFVEEPLELAIVEEGLGVPLLSANELLIDVARRMRDPKMS